MSLFSGIHEVRVLNAAGDIFAGYFDNEAAAVAAVERLADYKAAWHTLNPLVAGAVADKPINPDELVQSFHTAADEDIASRKRIVMDFDPIRTTGNQKDNATDAEKVTALAQAEECRDALTAIGWPAPTVIDSGNGIHLRYRVELPNDEPSHELVRGLLRSLAERYPLLDVTNHNASRVAKLPGSWARKSAHTDDRPHRISRLLEAGENTVVSMAQLTAAAPQTGTGAAYEAVPEVSGVELKAMRVWLLGYLEHFELVHRTEARRTTGGWKIGVYCPLTESDESPHDDSGDTSTILQIINGKLSFKYSHNSCEKQGRNTAAFKAEMARRNPVPYLPEPGQDAVAVMGSGLGHALPPLLQADLAMDFLKDNLDFMQLVDSDPPMLACWTGQSWELRKSRRLLEKAVNAYMKKLYTRYPAPAEGRDRRGMLKASITLSGVAHYAELDLPEARREQFDQGEFLLGLPGGMVADLETGETRPMLREDFVSQCLTVAPDANHPTPRWARFLLEVSLGDVEQATYLEGLASLCLNAHPTNAIFALFGDGRNGKSSYLKVLEGILGHMARSVRPGELSESQYADSQNKRTLAGFEGARMVCSKETKAKNLDFSLLKLLTGGDAVNGAQMRQDAHAIRATWKLLLTTNDAPVFPPDAAFKGRVHLIPFGANFSANPEVTIDATMHAELPGILAQLIRRSPSVIKGGLLRPSTVTVATDELFVELDIAARFQSECLLEAYGAVAEASDVRTVASHWIHREGLDVSDKSFMGELQKRFGKRYAFRKIGARTARVFTGVRLVDCDPQAVITGKSADKLDTQNP